jgi:FkbM family methyltransferase
VNLPPCLFLDRAGFETVCQEASRAVYLGSEALLCRVLTRYLMYADPLDTGFTPHICMEGYWESWITLAVARSLRPGAYCLDIGANHGYYSLLLGEAGRQGGRLLACEPNPRLVPLLARTLEVNGLAGWSRVVPLAVTDMTGHTVRLVVPGGRGLNGTICREPGSEDQVTVVATVTVDDLTADWPRVDFVKIDAEGAETSIWRGMQQTLGRCPDLCIVMEVCPARYADAAGFLADIEAAGFPLRLVDGAGGVQATDTDEVLSRPDQDTMLYLRRP